MKIKYIFSILAILSSPAIAQTGKGLSGFPELVMSDIPGAPKLGKPMLITGTLEAVMSEGNGWAAPAYYDWDGDGLKDLLIGEFSSGQQNGHHMGNFLRVYPNTGTETDPEFTGRFNYAYPPFEYFGNGTPYSVDQYCCIGFTPQFADLNADGYEDMITGQYQGEVTWFQRSQKGFMQGQVLAQEGNPRDMGINNISYWLYSSASFGDLTNDSLPDLITGGRSLRISKNVGTKREPRFAKRKLLLDIKGNPLQVYAFTPDELKEYERPEASEIDAAPVSGDHHLLPNVVDWDNDGILDLLVTNMYSHQNLAVVDFFKGVKVSGEHRFKPRVPLFTTKDASKAFPGSAPIVFVADWNSDGVNDLLIGTSVVTVRGKFNDQLSWSWEKDMELHGVGKDPANLVALPESSLQRYKQGAKLPPGITIEDYMTIRHQGYVYVMLGSKEVNREKSTRNQK